MAVSPKNDQPSIGWLHLDAVRWALSQFAREDLTATAKLVLMSMAFHVGDDACTVWPSQDRLARLVGVSRRAAQMAIDQLVASGDVVVTPQAEAGLKRPNLYRLPRCADFAHRCAKRAEDDAQELRINNSVPNQETRTSTARARQQTLDDATEAVLGFPVDGPGGPTWALRQALVDELTADFPKLDVLAECRAALAWVKANPHGRKTAAGMRRFLTGWLTRSNDRPRPPSTGYQNGARRPQSVLERIDRSYAEGEDNLAEALRVGRETGGWEGDHEA